MFNVTRKSDPQFQALTESLSNIRVIEQFNYNELGQFYNSLEVGEHVDFAFSRDKQTSLIQQLQRRGLERNKDYKLVVDDAETENFATNPETGEILVNEETGEQIKETAETAFITRLSTKDATMVVKSRGKRGAEGQEGGAQVTDQPIPPSTTTAAIDTSASDAANAEAVGDAPPASLGAPVAGPKVTTAVTKGAPAKTTAATKGAPARPASTKK